jgi:hypothetical protein
VAAQLDGLAAIRQLDVIVRNRLEHDPEAMAYWEEARKLQYVIRRRVAAASVDDEVPPVAPPAPPVPTSSAATSTPSTDAEAETGQSQLPKAS